MRCGISTACFYPDSTLDSLKQVVETGAPVTEIFLNTFSEMDQPYIEKLMKVVYSSGIQVASVHPFTSMLEGFFFASGYEGRFEDGMRIYRRYYEICRLLGADKLVFHGDHVMRVGGLSLEEYAKSFRTLAAVAREYGVFLCHENVSRCRLGDSAAVSAIRPLMREYAAFVLDIKQVLRKDASIEEMIQAMGRAIRHIHISDHMPDNDCLPPGQGVFDFPDFIKRMKEIGYKGDYIIEVYEDSFSDTKELIESMQYINTLFRPDS